VSIQRGLKQGYLVAPILFLLLVEGLCVNKVNNVKSKWSKDGLMLIMVRQTKSVNMFRGFSVGDSLMAISHLNFLGYTLFIEEVAIENTRIVRIILCCFNLSSSLRVNFTKTSVMEVLS